MAEVDLKKLMQRVVELVMPNLRHYYRVPRKGLVVKSYASDGSYWADVQPLRNDDSVDENEPLIPKVEIPIMWGGPDRGVVCPPAPGTLCDITYYDGDPNYPRISNFRWAKNNAPVCELGGFIIQQGEGLFIKISAEGNVITKTPVDLINEVAGNKTETVGADWNIEVTGKAKLVAPDVDIEASTKVSMNTPLLQVSVDIVAGGGVADAGGAKTMAGMRQVFGEHTHQEHGDGGGVTDPPAQGM
jgi:hypothetical protein